VVVLIDLLGPAGWRLAEDRLIDTLIGCAIVLLIGFAPWPMAWYSHLPRQFAQTTLDMGRYLEEVLGSGAAPGAAARSRLRRPTYRALADLRAEFQRTMSEPPAISRRAAAWWPAVIGLEQVMDAITAAGLAVSRSTGHAAPPDSVRRLGDALRAVSESALAGSGLTGTGQAGTGQAGTGQAGTVLARTEPAEVPGLPDDEILKPVSEAIRSLLGVLGPGQQFPGRADWPADQAR
jgi:uncharacterized membrane protein YccC